MQGPPADPTAEKMTPRGRRDYARLDEVGFDVIEELISTGKTSHRAIADRYGVAEINLTLWRRMRRTRIFVEETTPEQILDYIASGHSIAEIARKNDLSHKILAAWIQENIPASDVEGAREDAAESQFARAKDELESAGDDVGIRKAVERHKIDRFVAERTTKRYSDEKSVRVTGLEGVIFNWNTGALMPPEEPQKEEAK
jgi:transposase-like protein